MVEDLMRNQSSQLKGHAEAWSNNHFQIKSNEVFVETSIRQFLQLTHVYIIQW